MLQPDELLSAFGALMMLVWHPEWHVAHKNPTAEIHKCYVIETYVIQHDLPWVENVGRFNECWK